jgi:hypothetical protein
MRGLQTSVALVLAATLAATFLAACDWRPALSFAPTALPDATVGQPYSVEITVSGNQTPVGDLYPAGALPPGLSLPYDQDTHSSSATLSGTPTTAGTYQLTVSAWCLGTNISGQTGSHEYTLVVH